MKAPKVSIVIPTYNAGNSLESAIIGIINQTYKNTELIIVDALSVDSTKTIIQQYKQYIHHFISEPDKGIYDAMNKGINLATGEWIYFLGSDDTFFNNEVLASVFNDAENVNADVLYGNVLLNRRNILYDGAFDMQKLTFRNICHQAIFMRRKVFDLVGSFNLNYKILADYEHNIRWFTNEKISKKYIDLTIATYSETGISNSFVDEKFLLRKERIFKKLTDQELDFSNHYHLIGSIAVSHVINRKYLKGYLYALIVVVKIRDFQYIKQCMQLTKAALKNKRT
jgi:glycosyltransferase involved in cell wall biosynthesis